MKKLLDPHILSFHVSVSMDCLHNKNANQGKIECAMEVEGDSK